MKSDKHKRKIISEAEIFSSGYITDRNKVEKEWANRLSSFCNIEIKDKTNVDRDLWKNLLHKKDIIVDTSGQPSISSKYLGFKREYKNHLIALNTDIRGEFSELYPQSLVVWEGMAGYFWVFSKSENRANIGIG